MCVFFVFFRVFFSDFYFARHSFICRSSFVWLLFHIVYRTGKPVEISFFPVPNIDEVSFGTATNKAFGTEVAKDLGMAEYKPGSTIRTYLVQYSNIYWAKKVLGGSVLVFCVFM